MRTLTVVTLAILLMVGAAFASPVCTTASLATYENSSCTSGMFTFTFGSYTQPTGGLSASAINVTVSTAPPNAIVLSYSAVDPLINPFRAVVGTIPVENYTMPNVTITGPNVQGFAFLGQIDLFTVRPDSTGNGSAFWGMNADGQTSLAGCLLVNCSSPVIGNLAIYPNQPQSLTIANGLRISASGEGSRMIVGNLTDIIAYQVPEPGTIGLLLSGLLGLGLAARRRRA